MTFYGQQQKQRGMECWMTAEKCNEEDADYVDYPTYKALTIERDKLKDEHGQLRSALQRIAAYVGTSCSEKASHIAHLTVADEVSWVVSRSTKKLNELKAENEVLLQAVKEIDREIEALVKSARGVNDKTKT